MVNDEIITTLEGCLKAHKRIEELIYVGNKQLLELLEALQDMAISVGEAIENDYGMKQSAVLRLEEYCELLYQIHVKMELENNDTEEIKILLVKADKKNLKKHFS